MEFTCVLLENLQLVAEEVLVEEVHQEDQALVVVAAEVHRGEEEDSGVVTEEAGEDLEGEAETQVAEGVVTQVGEAHLGITIMMTGKLKTCMRYFIVKELKDDKITERL